MSLMVAFTHLLTGDTTQSILQCDEILSIEAGPNPVAFLIRGWAHMRRGEWENAEHDLSRVIDKMEVSEGLEALLGFAYRLRATCYEHQAEWNLCLSDLKKAIDLHEADADVDKDDLAELRDQLRDQQSRVEQQQAGEPNPSDVLPESAAPLRRPPRHEILDALVDGDLERALELCEAQFDDDKNVQFLRGMAKDFRGRRAWSNDKSAAETDFADAIAEYSEVIEDETSHFLARAYVRRAQLQIALQEPEKALADLDALAKRQLLNEDEPLNIHAGLSRGLAEMRCSRFDAAGDAFENVLHLDPKNVRARDGIGRVDLYTDHRSEALEHFKAALATSQERNENADIAHFTFMIALVYHLDEKYEQASAELETIKPMLGKLQESEQRQLGQKIETFRKYLPDRVPDPEEATEEEVRCKALWVDIQDLVPSYQDAA